MISPCSKTAWSDLRMISSFTLDAENEAEHGLTSAAMHGEANKNAIAMSLVRDISIHREYDESMHLMGSSCRSCAKSLRLRRCSILRPRNCEFAQKRN